jgi:5'-methylthioadenosine phosphorylase
LSVAVVLGSAFAEPRLAGRALAPVRVDTAHGPVTLYRWPGREGAWVLARHGLPHRHLPHQVPYRAHAAALAAVGVGALLLTSSVGVLDPALPLFSPLLVGDLVMPENRLPGGGPCTMWPDPDPEQAHLVLEEGLFSRALTDQLAALVAAEGLAPTRGVVFGYQPGPRTKTAAENRWYRAIGAQVNSMSLGPEVVLANELGIPVAALAIGHKRSGEGFTADDPAWVERSLAAARAATERIAARFLDEAEPVRFANRLFRFGGAT